MERDSEKPARAGAVKGRGEADRGIGHLRAWLIGLIYLWDVVEWNGSKLPNQCRVYLI